MVFSSTINVFCWRIVGFFWRMFLMPTPFSLLPSFALNRTVLPCALLYSPMLFHLISLMPKLSLMMAAYVDSVSRHLDFMLSFSDAPLSVLTLNSSTFVRICVFGWRLRWFVSSGNWNIYKKKKNWCDRESNPRPLEWSVKTCMLKYRSHSHIR